jgi:IclR family transcriptional regulator, KDG regulon repressor
MPGTRIKSVEKAIDLLMLFSEWPPGLSLSEVATALTLPESTAYRLLVTLQKKRFIARNPSTRKYGLDASLLRLQAAVSVHLDIARLAFPRLESLADRSGETAQLYILQGGWVVLEGEVTSRNALRYMEEEGSSEPLHASASGQAILAFMPAECISQFLQENELQPITPYTVTDRQDLTELLAQFRAQGFAISFQQVLVGIRAVAAPVFDHRGEPIASLVVGGSDPRLSNEKAESLGPILREQAGKLSAALGSPGRQGG